MEKVKIHSIQPVGGQRPSAPAQAKDPAAQRKWEQVLRDAGAQLESVSRQVNAPARVKPADPAALQDEVRQVNEQFQQVMKAHQHLSQLYLQLQIHKSDPDKA